MDFVADDSTEFLWSDNAFETNATWAKMSRVDFLKRASKPFLAEEENGGGGVSFRTKWCWKTDTSGQKYRYASTVWGGAD